MFYQVKTRSVIERDTIVEADSANEARAKASAAMYTFSDDEMLFEDDIALQEENILGVIVDHCELYDEDNDDFDGDAYDADEDEYDPPEYFSD